ncbi:type IV pilin N-terminal domain-containing protein [Halorubellus litoreus]|uniref:Type IV pilin N-terminal domain-containing protein n=1 Tax=Halorubellus litoreus TaxID=755308 RepID=A0ABD5VD94_9EURY
MQLRALITDEDAISSTIGVVLMVAVTVILAAAVGTFALGLAEESTKETPSASIETERGVTTVAGTTHQTMDITIIGGDALKPKFVTVKLDGSVVWNSDEQAGATTGIAIYNSKTWPTSSKIESGDTLGLREDGTTFTSDKTFQVVWNNGQKSQVLGSAAAN